MTDRLEQAQVILGHRFARIELLAEALTHRSAALSTWAGKKTLSVSNERLEFVGDRVLGLLIAEWLAERFPHENEGHLGRRLALLVSQPVLAEIAETLGLPAVLSVAPSESKAGVRKLATVVADAMEAAIGALYLDAGIETARGFGAPGVGKGDRRPAGAAEGSENRLAGMGAEARMPLAVYKLEMHTGPSHAPEFVISVRVGGQIGHGTAGSKRLAEAAAAIELLGKCWSHEHALRLCRHCRRPECRQVDPVEPDDRRPSCPSSRRRRRRPAFVCSASSCAAQHRSCWSTRPASSSPSASWTAPWSMPPGPGRRMPIW